MLATADADGGGDGAVKRELEVLVVLVDPELSASFGLAADQLVVSNSLLGVRRRQGGLGTEGAELVLRVCIQFAHADGDLACDDFWLGRVVFHGRTLELKGHPGQLDKSRPKGLRLFWLVFAAL